MCVDSVSVCMCGWVTGSESIIPDISGKKSAWLIACVESTEYSSFDVSPHDLPTLITAFF